MGKRHKIPTWECEVMPKVNVALYRNRAKLARDLSERDLPVPEFREAPAQSFAMVTDFGFCGFVLLEESELEPTDPQVMGLLAHEAVHVALRYLEEIGESNPSEEEMAYLTGSVAGALIHDQMEWGSRHGS